MNQEKIGKFILDLRKQNKMTQKEFADKLNVTAQAVSKWENGRGIPDIEMYLLFNFFEFNPSKISGIDFNTQSKSKE